MSIKEKLSNFKKSFKQFMIEADKYRQKIDETNEYKYKPFKVYDIVNYLNKLDLKHPKNKGKLISKAVYYSARIFSNGEIILGNIEANIDKKTFKRTFKKENEMIKHFRNIEEFQKEINKEII